VPQKRSGATAGLEESGDSAGGAECNVIARRARCHASIQRPDTPRARTRTTTAIAAPPAVPRGPSTRPSRRPGPPRAVLSTVRAPSACTARRRRSPRAILAPIGVSGTQREGSRARRLPCFSGSRPAPQLPPVHSTLGSTPPVPLPPQSGSSAPPRQIKCRSTEVHYDSPVSG
jgi:hypothetical protein